MKNIEIRKIREEDIEDVVDISIKDWKTAYKGIIDDEFLNNINREEKIKKRKMDYKENEFIVAIINKKVVGFCKYIDNNSNSPEILEADSEILALYVEINLKQTGIGKKLFNYVIKEFKEKNKKHMIIWCLEDNKEARKFYTKMGGKNISKRDIQIGNKKYKEIAYIYNIH